MRPRCFKSRIRPQSRNTAGIRPGPQSQCRCWDSVAVGHEIARDITQLAPIMQRCQVDVITLTLLDPAHSAPLFLFFDPLAFVLLFLKVISEFGYVSLYKRVLWDL